MSDPPLDGGVHKIDRAECPTCDDGGDVREMPEAGYVTCLDCGERGFLSDDGAEWWRNDPESQWYVEPDPDGGDAP